MDLVHNYQLSIYNFHDYSLIDLHNWRILFYYSRDSLPIASKISILGMKSHKNLLLFNSDLYGDSDDLLCYIRYVYLSFYSLSEEMRLCYNRSTTFKIATLISYEFIQQRLQFLSIDTPLQISLNYKLFPKSLHVGI